MWNSAPRMFSGIEMRCEPRAQHSVTSRAEIRAREPRIDPGRHRLDPAQPRHVLEIASRPPADEHVGARGEIVGKLLVQLQRSAARTGRRDPRASAPARRPSHSFVPDHTDGLLLRRLLGVGTKNRDRIRPSGFFRQHCAPAAPARSRAAFRQARGCRPSPKSRNPARRPRVIARLAAPCAAAGETAIANHATADSMRRIVLSLL